MSAPSNTAATRSKLIPALVLLIGLLVFFWLYQQFNLGQWLSLETLKNYRAEWQVTYQQSPALTLAIFFAIYVVAAALSIPGALILTLAAGALFGLGWGLVVVSFASSLGALCAFLAARYFLRNFVQQKFGKALAPINAGIQKNGDLYLLTLRLVPLFPFWLVNLLISLTPISAFRFYLVSQIGMLAGTAVYVNAGTQLALIESTADIFSPALIGSFVLLGIFPLFAKALVDALQRRKVYARWQRPQKFSRNVVVIGAGAGGLVSAYIGVAVKAKVTLIEAHKMGGDCLNFGCVPSKALIRSAKLVKEFKNAAQLGVTTNGTQVDFAAVMARVHRVIADIAPHDSVERYTELGVEVMQGHARLTSPWTVEVTHPDGTQETLTTRNIIIAAGAQPFVPPIPGLDQIEVLTSDNVWQLTALPQRFIVLGGGPIGCELAQSFARLGSQVTQVEMGSTVMGREDPEVSQVVMESLRADGVNLLLGHQAIRVEVVAGEKRLIVKHDNIEHALPFDQLLCAVGRTPRISGYGLDTLGIPLTGRKTIETNDYLQTLYPNIFAVGDVAGPYQFTHTAAHQAWFAAVNALFGRFKKFKADYRVIPWATFTDPEVARVGLSETDAQAQGIAYQVTRYGIDDLDRAIADDSAHGFVKVLTVPGKDKILGVTIVGTHAGDLLAEFVLAMKHNLGLNKILGTIHTYPTLSEANKYAAGEWKRANTPHKLLAWVKRYHDWQRG